MIPTITITELDGALGILPPDGKLPLAIVGTAASSASLPVNTPAAYAREKDLEAALVRGGLLEAGAYGIERFGNTILAVRSTATTPGSFGTIDVTGVTGTSVVTMGAPAPDDDYQLYLKVITGGTIGTAGITLVYSRDNGRTVSAAQALGTANTFVVPGTGGATFNFGVGTLVAGDVVKCRTHAPSSSATDLGLALDALGNTVQAWELCEIVGEIDAAKFDVIAAKVAAWHTAGKHRAVICAFRMPNDGETEAAYKTAFDTAFSAKSDLSVVVCAGADETSSGVTGDQYMRPPSFFAAALAASVSEEIDLADADTVGAAPGVNIRDTNGNPKYHDETINPGLDDSRALVLRTIEGRQGGVYVNNPRILAPVGSDFQYLQYRRVMNIARATLRDYFITRLSKVVRLNPATGFIREDEARAIEAAVKARLRTKLLTKPKASAIDFVLSRTDNILSTFTLTGTCRITPLGYSKFFDIEVGFRNPALLTA